MKTIAKILKTTMNLPDRIQAICWVQFWAWIGWFPFLFYSTTWVGEVYFRYHPASPAKTSKDALGDVGRVGSLSLVVFSIITFIASILLPWVVQSPTEGPTRNFTPRPPANIPPFIAYLHKNKPDLLTAWQWSHLIFAGSMCLAPFVRSLRMATILVSVCGIPWALACWAPFAFIGVEINRLTAPTTMYANGTSYRRLSNAAGPDNELASPAPSPTFLRLNHLDRDVDDASSGAESSTGETAGIYLGILNLFTTLPQFVGTFISMIVFSILEPGKSPELHEDGGHEEVLKAADGPNAIAVCLFVGAVSAVAAAYATSRMKAGLRGGG